MLSSWSFVCIFAAAIFFEPFRMIQIYVSTDAGTRGRRHLVILLAAVAVAALLALIVFKMLGHPYGSHDYRAVRLITGGGVLGALLLAFELIRAYWFFFFQAEDGIRDA